MESSLKHKAMAGVAWVGMGRLATQVALTGGNILLARILLPGIWGQFAIINFVVSGMGMVVNLALGQALIQRSTEPARQDVGTVSWMKLGLGVAAWLGLIAVRPLVGQFYAGVLDRSSLELIPVLGLTVILANIRTASVYLLERRIDYQRLVVVEVFEVAVTQGLSLVLAAQGWGLASFVWGVVGGRAAGSLAAWVVEPKGFAWEWSELSARSYLQFGSWMQMGLVVGFASSALVPVVVGRSLGAVQVGILTWAGSIALGTKVFADVVARVIFPTSARLQGDRMRLDKLMRRGLLVSLGLSLPLVLAVGILARPLVAWVYTAKWLPGLPILYLYLLGAPIGIVETIGTRIWLGVAGAGGVLRWNLVCVAVTWAVTIMLMGRWGALGVPIGSLAGSGVMVVGWVRWWRGRR